MFRKIFILLSLCIIFQLSSLTARILSEADKTKPELRIFNATECEYGKYAVQLVRDSDMKLKPYRRKWCAASLLSVSWALTAAQCVQVRSIRYRILVTMSNEEPYIKQTIFLKEIIPHPKFEVTTLINDIALGRLEKDVKLNDYIKITRLPLSSREMNAYLVKPPCPRAQIIGWRTEKAYEPVCGTVRLLASDGCEEIDTFMKFDYLNRVRETQFCSVTHAAISPCEGDIGGPMFCDEIQTGIISWGGKCGKIPAFGIYSRIDWQLQFISDARKGKIKGRSHGCWNRGVKEILLIFLIIFNFFIACKI